MQVDESQFGIPNVPDPLWPEEVVPTHLSECDKNDKLVSAAWKAVGVDTQWRCVECGNSNIAERSPKRPAVCNRCYENEVTNTALSRKTNEGWMEQSEALGLAVYERQPEETDEEWRIWQEYSRHYPLRLPKWTELAAACGCSVGKVTRAANRWNYKARMIAWARFVDSDTQEKRITALREMNEKQLSMAQSIQEKLTQAIDMIDPQLLKPNEIVNLFKVSVELERKIRATQEEKVESTSQDTKATVKTRTSAENIAEVLSILENTGVMPEGKKIVGVETKTTMLIKEDESGY